MDNYVFTSSYKSPVREISIMFLEVFLPRLHHPQGHQLESLLLEPLDDVAAEAALHAVRLDHDEGALVVAHL